MSSNKKKNSPSREDSRVDIPVLEIPGEDENALPLEAMIDDEAHSGPAESFLQLDPEESAIEPSLHHEHQQLEAQVNDIRNQRGEDPLTSNQIEILKRYIELKEAEVRDLRSQQQKYQDFVQKAGVKIDKFVKKNRHLTAAFTEAQRTVDHLQAEIQKNQLQYKDDLQLLKSDFDDKLRQAGAAQEQFRELMRKREEFKDKVREDLKRIKLKERELENKYDLLRTDTQTLLDAKDKQILELKKKGDALDLELETLDEKLRETANVLNQVSAKKRRLIETLKLAISLLEDIDKESADPELLQERKAG
ncbi:MAG: hypothetical protein EBQ85_06205 [Proteobacteria bacterium]|nr:hypothetical protein [Pseudomonadota bacterium]